MPMDVDIRTGRPADESHTAAADQAAAERKKQLEAAASWSGVTETAAGLKLVELIRSQLEARIRALVQADPEARALAGLLKTMGHKEATARMAIDRLYTLKKRSPEARQ